MIAESEGTLVAEESTEPVEEYYFKYDATLRIFGQIPDLEEITRTLGLSPTRTVKRGDRRQYSSQFFEHDMWMYKAPVPEDRPLDVHIQTLWAHLKPHQAYLMGLKERLTVDVFCGYRSNCGSAGIRGFASFA